MREIYIFLTVFFCCFSISYAQQSKPEQKVSKPKKTDSVSSSKSITRIFELTGISAVKDGDVFIGGRNTSFVGDNRLAYGLFLKISKGEIVTKELPFLKDVKDIFFLNNLTGWVSGIGGTYKTENGGQTWEKVSNSDDIRGHIFFLNDTTGWYFGKDEYLKRVENAETRKLKRFEDFPYVRKLQFTSLEKGWLSDVVDGQDRFLHTENGGETWNPVNIDNDGIDDFQFFNDFQGFAIASGGLYYTNDGAKSWEQIKKQTKGNWFNRIFFIDKEVGWLIGNEVHFTGNGGKNWKSGKLPEVIRRNTIRGVVFTDVDNGWLLTNDGLYFTNDSGFVWQKKKI